MRLFVLLKIRFFKNKEVIEIFNIYEKFCYVRFLLFFSYRMTGSVVELLSTTNKTENFLGAVDVNPQRNLLVEAEVAFLDARPDPEPINEIINQVDGLLEGNEIFNGSSEPYITFLFVVLLIGGCLFIYNSYYSKHLTETILIDEKRNLVLVTEVDKVGNYQESIKCLEDLSEIAARIV